MYALMIVSKEKDVLIMGRPYSVELSWYEGQIGAIPCFRHKGRSRSL